MNTETSADRSVLPDEPAPLGASTDRIASLDFVRGIAVLGILTANILGLGQPLPSYGWPGGFLVPTGPLDDWLWGAQLVLVDGKFRGLFTLLFGAGLVLFARRAQARGAGGGLLARRLAWLGLFGFAHWALLWRGDILMSYALAGFAVLPFVGWDWTKQLTLGLIGYAVGALLMLSITLPMTSAAQGRFPSGSTMAAIQQGLLEGQAADIADGKVEAALIASGDHGAVVAHALDAHLSDLPFEMLFFLFETAPLMLIGMALLGAGLFDGRVDTRRQARVGWALWGLGTLAALPIAWRALKGGINYWDVMGAGGWLVLPQLFAALGLIALLSLWGQKARGWLALRFAAAGRCAFSNYLGTSALALAVFSGWGLGLFGKLGRLELYGVMLLFWIVMLAWPVWWLARYRFGPLEWLWRCLTYGRRFPLRR